MRYFSQGALTDSITNGKPLRAKNKIQLSRKETQSGFDTKIKEGKGFVHILAFNCLKRNIMMLGINKQGEKMFFLTLRAMSQAFLCSL